MKDEKDKTVTLDADELEQVLDPLMALRAILACAGECETKVDPSDVATVLGAVLRNIHSRIGYPVRGEIL